MHAGDSWFNCFGRNKTFALNSKRDDQLGQAQEAARQRLGAYPSPVISESRPAGFRRDSEGQCPNHKSLVCDRLEIAKQSFAMIWRGIIISRRLVIARDCRPLAGKLGRSPKSSLSLGSFHLSCAITLIFIFIRVFRGPLLRPSTRPIWLCGPGGRV